MRMTLLVVPSADLVAGRVRCMWTRLPTSGGVVYDLHSARMRREDMLGKDGNLCAYGSQKASRAGRNHPDTDEIESSWNDGPDLEGVRRASMEAIRLRGDAWPPLRERVHTRKAEGRRYCNN